MTNKRDCEHGSQIGKCDTCDLFEAYNEIESLRTQLAKANEQLQSVCNHNATQQPEITRLRAELAKANERVKELTKENLSIVNSVNKYSFDDAKVDFSVELNKFAIEKKIEAINAVLDLGKLYTIGEVDQWAIDDAKVERFIEQLRKEQE